MGKFAGTPADDPKGSADDLDNINEEEEEDHSQPTPAGDDRDGDGPSVADAFRSGG